MTYTGPERRSHPRHGRRSYERPDNAPPLPSDTMPDPGEVSVTAPGLSLMARPRLLIPAVLALLASLGYTATREDPVEARVKAVEGKVVTIEQSMVRLERRLSFQTLAMLHQSLWEAQRVKDRDRERYIQEQIQNIVKMDTGLK